MTASIYHRHITADRAHNAWRAGRLSEVAIYWVNNHSWCARKVVVHLLQVRNNDDPRMQSHNGRTRTALRPLRWQRTRRLSELLSSHSVTRGHGQRCARDEPLDNDQLNKVEHIWVSYSLVSVCNSLFCLSNVFFKCLFSGSCCRNKMIF